MRARRFSCFAVIFAAMCGAFAGCATQPREVVLQGERYYVPTAALIQRPGNTINAANVLACGDDDVIFGRAEKSLDGAVPMGGISAFTIYTYDAQRISSDRGSSGYRYRWVVQQGISASPAP